MATAEWYEIVIDDVTDNGVILCPLPAGKEFPPVIELIDGFWELLHIDSSDGRAYYIRG